MLIPALPDELAVTLEAPNRHDGDALMTLEATDDRATHGGCLFRAFGHADEGGCARIPVAPA